METKKNHWKIVAIIFIVLFLLETSGWVYASWYVSREKNKDLVCYYEICADSIDALREGNLCSCYDYDLIGNLNIVKTKLMN